MLNDDEYYAELLLKRKRSYKVDQKVAILLFIYFYQADIVPKRKRALFRAQFQQALGSHHTS